MDQESPAENSDLLAAEFIHELKNPLHSIISITSLLLSEVDGPLSEEQKRQASLILANAEQLQNLVASVLGQGITKLRMVAPKLEALVLRPFLEEIVSSMALSSRSVKFELFIEPELEQRSIETDQTLLRQIIGNLLANASKYSPPEGVVSLEARLGASEKLLFIVSDQGLGIERHKREQVFSALSQSNPRGFASVGLGLSITARAIEKLGGVLELRSESGKGALFEVSLPLKSEDAEFVRVISDSPATRRVLELALLELGVDYDLTASAIALDAGVEARKSRYLIIDGSALSKVLASKEGLGRFRQSFSDSKLFCLGKPGVGADFPGLEVVLAEPYSVAKLREALKQWIKLKVKR